MHRHFLPKLLLPKSSTFKPNLRHYFTAWKLKLCMQHISLRIQPTSTVHRMQWRCMQRAMEVGCICRLATSAKRILINNCYPLASLPPNFLHINLCFKLLQNSRQWKPEWYWRFAFDRCMLRIRYPFKHGQDFCFMREGVGVIFTSTRLILSV